MTRLLYIDAIGGLAGDMILAALIDAGAEESTVSAGLRELGAGNLELTVSTEYRHGIAASRVVVTGSDSPEISRTWKDVRELINRARLPIRAQQRALDVFETLARGEGAIHGVSPEQVRFHEVGAIDSIGDICGIALALESLQIEEIACSPLPVGRGLIESKHGRLPLPAPAALDVLCGAPLYGVDITVELVTPTGAAFVAALATEWGPMPALRLERVGYGAGSRDLATRPNLVRVMIGERTSPASPAKSSRADVTLIETNLDDLSPQLLPIALNACFAAGALDVWITPAQMKKGRPGFVLSALARPSQEHVVAETILRETTTLGVRFSTISRWELDRDWRTVTIAGEPIRIKVAWLDGRIVNMAPEHDDCATVADRIGRPVKTVWAAALAAAEREILI